MTTFLLKATKVTVLHYAGTDTIYFHLEAPTAFPEMKYPPVVKMEARAGYGETWVKELGVDPGIIEVIEARPAAGSDTVTLRQGVDQH